MSTTKEGGLIAWFTRNHVAANLMMLAIIVGGFYSLMRIQREMLPEINTNIISVQLTYPGAAPQEVETGIIDKVEEVLESVDGLKQVLATAGEGGGSFSIQVQSGYDVGEVLDQVKMQIDSVSSFPDSMEKPVIYRQKFSSDVLWISVYGDADNFTLKEFVKELSDDIKINTSASRINIYGSNEYEISIEVSDFKLRKYGLTFDQVVAAVQASSIDLPSGFIKTVSGDILVRTKGIAESQVDFEDIVLLTRTDGTYITIGDIAMVKDGFIEDEGFARFDGKPTMSLNVKAVGDEDVLQIAGEIKSYIAERRKELPPSLDIAVWADSSYYLEDRLDLMTENIIYGAGLVFIILAMFLHLRVAFWVMLGIPICFLGSILLMKMPMFDISINMVSLFAFILVLGIVVDDAIIIGESAFSDVEKLDLTGEPDVEREERAILEAAVISGANRVAVPATFGVLTTIAAFAPMVMVGGPLSVLWKSIAWVVIFCLAFSLIESKFILPAHLAQMKIQRKAKRGYFSFLDDIRGAISRWLTHVIHNHYKPFLKKVIEYRYATLSVFIMSIVLMFVAMMTNHIATQQVPNLPSDFVQASIEMHEGAGVKQTEKALDELELALNRVDAKLVKDTGKHIVSHTVLFNEGDSGGQLITELTKEEDSPIDAFELVRRWREETKTVPGVKRFSFSASSDENGGEAVEFQLSSESLLQLKAATEALKEELTYYPGVHDVESNLTGAKNEVVLAIKPEGELIGLTLSDIARQVRNGFYGAEAQRIQRDGEEIKVMIRYPKAERVSLGDLEKIRLRGPDGQEIPFDSVAAYVVQPGIESIIRVDGRRSAILSATVDTEKMSSDLLVRTVEEDVLPDIESDYPSVTVEKSGATKENQKTFAELMAASFVVLLAIYALLAVPLRSYSQPLIIMSVIPFGIIGAVIGHMILGMPVNIMSGFGIVALSGVVVNDSILMVEFVNRAREQGIAIKDAIIDSGTKRFRAIILTSLTTFIGLVPILFEDNLQAKIMIPMAVSLAFGILFATLITLILIPCLYAILEDIKSASRYVLGREEKAYVR